MLHWIILKKVPGLLFLNIVWWVVTQTGAIIFATEERDKG